MGRCWECDKDMGWFISGCCSPQCRKMSEECRKMSEERKIRYNDRVLIIDGFYKGQSGNIIGDYRAIGHDNARFAIIYGYKIKFNNKDEKYVNQFHIEKILNKG